MKKKITAILCIVLAATMCISLFACNDGMFDGSFKKEATAEEAKAAWDSATKAILGEEAVAALALAGDDESAVKGWSGIAFTVSAENTTAASAEDSSLDVNVNLSASGSVLFDMSGFSVNANINGNVQDKAVDAKIGAYMKDDVYYSDMTFNKAVMQTKADLSGTSLIPDINDMLGEALSSVSQAIASIGLDYTANILAAMPYEELSALGLKAYINTSGDYNRVKFEFPVEFLARLNDVSEGETEAYLETVANASVSLIVVTDKETDAFSGAKVDMEYSFKADTDNAAAGSSSKMSMSISDAAEITDYPANMEDFKPVEELTLSEVSTFFTDMMDSLGDLMSF